jgi:hypothetical protein
MSNRYGYTISYVGSVDPLDTIEPGSLIRLSLAHWWKPEDSDDEERCYLQLSGCLIEGNEEGDAIPQHKEAASMVNVDESTPNKDWFDNLEQELDRLLLEKANIEEKISDLRSRIMQQMTEHHLDKFYQQNIVLVIPRQRRFYSSTEKLSKQKMRPCILFTVCPYRKKLLL